MLQLLLPDCWGAQGLSGKWPEDPAERESVHVDQDQRLRSDETYAECR